MGKKHWLSAGVMTMAVMAMPALAATWDITDTGQPHKDVAFTVTEGTWISVDVRPDGREIMFDVLGDLYRIPAAGGSATLVRGGPAIERTARYSPDGSRIVYISDRSGSDNIWVADADGANPRQVSHETTAMLMGASWSADGRYIVAARVESGFDDMKTSELRLYSVDGGAGRVVVAMPENGRDIQEPQISPDGRHVYYTHRLVQNSIYVDANHANFAIKRRDLVTGETEEVVKGFGGALTPQLSKDGKKLAFIRRVKEKTVLFVYDTATGEQRPVYDNLDRDLQADFVLQGNYYPQYGWFPDNRHIAIWGKGRIFRIDSETGQAAEIPFKVDSKHRITRTERVKHDLAPEVLRVRAIPDIALSPDNKNMVFSGIGQLWRKTLDGGAPVRLTKARAFESEPSYAADGRRIVYVEWDDEKGGALMTVGASGGTGKTVLRSPGVVRQPAFSRDGKRIVYRIEDANKNLGGYRAKAGIYWLPGAGGTPVRVAEHGEHPRFSADGSRIYFTRRDGADMSIRSVNIDGFDERVHALASGYDISELKLSPDGRWLSFLDRHQYYVMPYKELGVPVAVSAATDAVPVMRLTKDGGHALSWSADSSMLHWVLGETLYSQRVADLKPGMSPTAPRTAMGLEVKSDVPDGALAFTNARIITMKGDEVIENGTVVVRNNKILAVGSAAEVQVPGDAKTIDASGKTIMPGLVDMHGHIDCCYMGGLVPQKQSSFFAAMAFGITTNYDPYTSEFPSYVSTELQIAGKAVGPRFIGVGKVVYGRDNKSDGSFMPIADYDDARTIMARKRAYDGIVIKSYKQPMRQQRQQLVKAGRELGVMVDVEGESHFYNNIGMLLDGHMALEHNLPVANYYDDVIQLMAHAEAANTPTLIVTFGELFGENFIYQQSRSWEDPKIRSFVQEIPSAGYSALNTPYSAPPHVRGMTTIHVADELWDIGFRSVSRSVRKQDDAGVIVNVGSHGQVYGLAMHWEMRLFAEGGMSNHNILRASTLNGAKTLGLDGQIGSLEPGKLADLIVLDRNPLEDIRNSNSVRYTMMNGRLYDAFTMNEIGNYNRPRGKFYWERQDTRGIDWNEAWAGQ